MAKLLINPNTDEALEIQLKPGSNYLGRSNANDFRLEDPSVSGSHCEIVVDGGSVLVKDLGSTNGTYINRAPVKEGSLHSGEILALGCFEMVFEDEMPIVNSPVSSPATGRIRIDPSVLTQRV